MTNGSSALIERVCDLVFFLEGAGGRGTGGHHPSETQHKANDGTNYARPSSD